MRHVRSLVWILVFASTVFGQAAYNGVARIVAVGDVHGDYEAFVGILRSAGVIDQSNKWIGGATHLVQAGDCLDRGPDSRKVLDLLISLEKEAGRGNGKVHALLGNHEAMNMYGDLRYVSPGEYNSYRTGKSIRLREHAYHVLADPAQKDDQNYRDKWYEEHPLGWVEHRQAFAINGQYGKIFAERDAVVKINDVLFLHGGISQKYVSMPIEEMNRRIRAELKDFNLLQGGIVTDDQGPLWDRGLALRPEAEAAGLVDSILTAYGVSRIVIAHTPTTGAVTPRFGGKVILIDVGLSQAYNRSPACLIIEDGKFFTMHRGTKIPIPDEPDSTTYLKKVADADPQGTNLRKAMGLGENR